MKARKDARTTVALPLTILGDWALPPHGRVVYAALLADADLGVPSTYDTLEERLGLSERQICRYLAELEAHGLCRRNTGPIGTISTFDALGGDEA